MTRRLTKVSPVDAGCRQQGQQRKVQRTLAVDDEVDEGKSSGRWPSANEEVDNKSPADAGGLQGGQRQKFSGRWRPNERGPRTVTLYHTVLYYFWTYEITGVLGLTA